MPHLSRLLSFLALLVLFSLPAFSWAQGTATVTQYATYTITSPSDQSASGWFSTRDAACASSLSISLSYYVNNSPAYGPYTSGLISSSPTCQYWIKQANGAYVPASGPVNYPYNTRTTSGSLPCLAAGTKKVVNVTAGYTMSRNGAEDVLALPSLVTRIGTNMCVVSGGSSCTYTIGQPVDSWSSSKPTSSGLYRISDDWEMISTGASCTATAEDKKLTDLSDPVPACPGAFGTVNGVPTCVPTAPGVEKPSPAPNNTAGNPSAGSNGDDPLGTRSPSTGTNNGNSGSAPDATDGTPLGPRGTGYPATSGTTGAASGGTTNVEVNVETCGLPGKPPCKLDESGTPDPVPSDVYGPQVDAVGQEIGENRGVIAGDSDKSFFSSWGLFFSAPPVVACEPMPLPEHRGVSMGQLDPCPVVGGVRDVMAWLWALAALYLSLRMIRQVL